MEESKELRTGSVIVISNSDRFPLYLDKLMISNSHFKDLAEFNNMFTNYPLTASKIILFESGILDIQTIQQFCEIVTDTLAQVGEILLLVEPGFKEYFEVSLTEFNRKKFVNPEITYNNLEQIITETKSYQLKTKMEVADVVQRKRKGKKIENRIGEFQTRITIDRRAINTKISREEELLNKDILIAKRPPGEPPIDSEFNYERKRKVRRYGSNIVLLNDIGFNVYNMIKTDYSEGKKLLFIDNTDSMIMSFLVENDKNFPRSVLLEELYSEGTHIKTTKEYFEGQDICTIRNSYNMKKEFNQEDINNLIKFVVGRYSGTFETVYIVVDDIKVNWAGALRYIILPPTIDNLMKVVNYSEDHKKDKVRNTFIKLDESRGISSKFKVDQNIARKYFSNLGLENIKVLDGNLDLNNVKSSYLFDILDIEQGAEPVEIDRRYVEVIKKQKGGKRN